jgi:spermidine synthase
MDKRANRIIGLSVIFSGFCALSAQILFIREFLIVFYGNELSLGFIFASWLISVAIGSFAFALFSARIKQKVILFSLCLAALSFLLPFSLILIRLSRAIMGFNTGEIVPLFPIAAASFALLFPVCIFFGYIFALACDLYRTNIKAISGKISGVYILEAVGSGVAGILVNFFLIRLFDSLEIILFICIFSLILALLLIFFSKERFRRLFLLFYSGLIILFSLFLLTSGIEKLNNYVTRLQWEGYEVITSKNSIYSNITVAKRNSQIVMFENGILVPSPPDNKMAAEESVHFTLLESRNPQKVLLIGGGVSGLLDEILKYPVTQIDYLEIDPLLVSLSRKYLADISWANDKRVHIKNTDARFFIKSTGEKYDCIIVSAAPPQTARLNRYYTVEFFGQLRNRLNPGGVISLSLNSSENYINSELRQFLQSIYVSLKKSFSEIKVIPGDTVYFLASDSKDYLTDDAAILLQRLKERGIKTEYVREYYLFSKLSGQRVSYIEAILNHQPQAMANYDFKPMGYFYNLIFWTKHFKDSFFILLLNGASALMVRLIFAIFAVIVILTGLTRLKRARFRNEVCIFSVFITGFSSMAIQIITLLCFQIIYGYLFYKIGFILSAFMIGVVFGGYYAVKYSIPKDALKGLILVQFMISVYAIILPFVFNFLIEQGSSFAVKFGQNVVFLILPAICGILCGAQFSYVNKTCLRKEEDSARLGGFTYAADLFGSCIAAFVAAVFLIPVVGIFQACLLIVGLNLLVLAFLPAIRLK